MSDEKKVDLAELAKELTGPALELLKGKLEGAEEDLKNFGRAILKDMLTAVKTGDEAWRSELVEQTKVLGEIQRLRAVGAGWEIVTQTLWNVAKIAMKAVSLTTIVS
jgi:hypothetical protein